MRFATSGLELVKGGGFRVEHLVAVLSYKSYVSLRRDLHSDDVRRPLRYIRVGVGAGREG